MTKENWKTHYNEIYDIFADFSTKYNITKVEKNKKIKQIAEISVHENISYAINIIKRNEETYKLLLGDYSNKSNEHFFLEELRKPYYFIKDISDYLNKVNNKINE